MTLVVLFAAANIFAQNDTDYSKYPGYVDFGNLSDNVIEIKSDSDLGKVIKSARVGQELWFVFLILALLMLLLEVLLIKRIEGRT